MSGSKPCDLSIQSKKKLVEATTIVSSVENGFVLVVEGAGISATIFESSSNSGEDKDYINFEINIILIVVRSSVLYTLPLNCFS